MAEAPPILRGFIGEAPVLERLARAGLPAVYTEEKPPFFPFHGSCGAWLVHGTLYYGPQTDADTFGHEACHALLLTPEQRAVWNHENTPTSEETTMALQVELWRRIRGAGVRRAVRWMMCVGYAFGEHSGGSAKGIERGAWSWFKQYTNDLPEVLPWK